MMRNFSADNSLNGIMYVPALQVIYLDFDGEITGYNGEILRIEQVEIQNSGLDYASIGRIAFELNRLYDGEAVFVTERPVTGEFSTVFIGKTDAFNQYGYYAGLAETVDSGNLNKSDNAFVFLDHTASVDSAIGTISHEVDHLLGKLDHGGESLDRYACTYHNHLLSGDVGTVTGLSHYNSVFSKCENADSGWPCSTYYSYNRGKDLILNGAWFRVIGCEVNGVTLCNSHTMLFVNSSGRVSSLSAFAGYADFCQSSVLWGGRMSGGGINIYDHAVSYDLVVSGGYVAVGHINGADNRCEKGSAIRTTLYNGRMYVKSSSFIEDTRIYGGEVYLDSANTSARNTEIFSGGILTVAGHRYSENIANNTMIHSSGLMAVNGFAFTTHIKSGGVQIIQAGLYSTPGQASNTVISSGGYQEVDNSGQADATLILGGGVQMLLTHGHASNTVIYSQGVQLAGFWAHIHSADILYGGYIESAGGRFYGNISIAGQILVRAEEYHSVAASDCRLTFELSERTVNDDFMISGAGIDKIDGGNYFISVSTGQQKGRYKLAVGAEYFNREVALVVDHDEKASLTVSGFIVYSGREYRLVREAGCLYLDITNSIIVRDFDELQRSINHDRSRYNYPISLPDFNAGWGRKVNGRPHIGISLKDVSVVLTQSFRYDADYAVTLRGNASFNFAGFQVTTDVAANDENGFTVYMKETGNGELEYCGEWDLVGSFTVSFSPEDLRRRFRLFGISEKALIGKFNIDTLSNKLKISVKQIFSDNSALTVEAGLKEVEEDWKWDSLFIGATNLNSSIACGFFLQDISIKGEGFADDGSRSLFAGSLRLSYGKEYSVNRSSYLEKFGFSRRRRLNLVNVSVAGSVWSDGSFEAEGGVALFYDAQTEKSLIASNANARILRDACTGSISVEGQISLAGIISVDTKFDMDASGIFISVHADFFVPGWLGWLSSAKIYSGGVCFQYKSSTNVSTLTVWGAKTNRENATTYYGKVYNLVTGESRDIGSHDLTRSLTRPTIPGYTWNLRQTEGKNIHFCGDYALTASGVEVTITADNGDRHFYRYLDGELYYFHNGVEKTESDVLAVKYFDDEGFKIGVSPSASGKWSVFVDSQATLQGLEVYAVETPDVFVAASLSVIGFDEFGVTLSYSVETDSDYLEIGLFYDTDGNNYRGSLIGEPMEKSGIFRWNFDQTMPDGVYYFYLYVQSDMTPVFSDYTVPVMMDWNISGNKPVIAAEVGVDSVILKGLFPIFAVRKEFSPDGKKWYEYEDDVVVRENGTFYFRGIDEYGIVTEVAEYTVSNLTSQNAPTVSTNITEITNRNVTLTAFFDQNAVKKQYSLNGKSWRDYIGEIIVSKNATFFFRSIDSNGNYSETAEFAVGNIDKTAPKVKKITATVSDYSAVIQWNGSDNSGISHYVVTGSNGEQFICDSSRFVFDVIGIGKHKICITAFDIAGNQSKPVSASFSIIDATPPVPVRGLCTEGEVTDAGGGILVWEIPEDNSGAVAAYEVLLNGKVYKSIKAALKVSKLVPGEYSWQVRAVDKAKNFGEWSKPAVFFVKDATPPVNLKVKVSVQGYDAGFEFSAKDNSGRIASYSIVCGEKSTMVSSSAIVLTGFGVGKQIGTVVAYDVAGNASKAAKLSFTIKDVTPPEIVTGLSVSNVDEKYFATLAWDTGIDNSGKVAKYEILLDSGRILKSKKNFLNVSKLSVGEHTFKVRAVDKDKNIGEWSEIQTFFIEDATPPGKVVVKAKIGQNALFLSWKKPKDNVGVIGYELRYGANFENFEILDADQLFFEINDLVKGDCFYELIAFDAAGNQSLATVGKAAVRWEPPEMAATYGAEAVLQLDVDFRQRFSSGLAAM